MNEFWTLELETLKHLYSDESQLLTDALLQGADWEELLERRKMVTQLSLVIDMRREGMNSPGGIYHLSPTVLIAY